MEIGERIHHYRTSCGMTQEYVAKKLQTTPQNIYKYEKGIIKNIPLQSIVLMAELFGVSPAELAGISDPSARSDASGLTPSSDKVAFGLRLRARREECGFSVRELALKLHLLPSIVESYELGKFDSIDNVRLHKIAELLSVSPEYFSDADLPETDELKLSDDERLLILKYRVNPQYHSAIHQLLGISLHDAKKDSSERFFYPELSSSDLEELQTRGLIAQPMGEYHAKKKDD